jgi:hypothetical protein
MADFESLSTITTTVPITGSGQTRILPVWPLGTSTSATGGGGGE